MKEVYLVTLEAPASEFKYVLGIFDSGSKADAAGWYEVERRRLASLSSMEKLSPRTVKVTKVEINKIYSTLSVDVIEKIKNGA